VAERAHEAAELPLSTRELVEILAERMEVGSGRWRLELEFQDGTLTRWFRHQGPGPAGALGQFDR
jgi:hypothetical protein